MTTSIIRKILLSAYLIMAAGFLASGQSEDMCQSRDVIIMKDGTKHRGYISEQTPKGDIVITAFNSEISLGRDSISVSTFDGSTIIKCGKEVYSNVEIQEDGDLVTFVRNQKTLVPAKISDVERITKVETPFVLDIIQADRAYEGTITENVMGKFVKIKTDDMTYVINNKNIKSQSRKTDAPGRENLDMTVFPLLDVYEMKDKSTVTGLLVSQNMSDGSLIFKTSEGALLPLNLANITKVRRIENPDFKEVVVPVDTSMMADITINKQEVTPADVIYEKTDILCLPLKAGNNMVMIEEDEISVVSKERVPIYDLIPFNPLEGLKNDYIRIGKVTMLEAVQPESLQEDGLRKDVYKDVQPGYYILYNKKDHKAIPLWVVNK